MNPSLRLVVEWPNGMKLPVRVPATATGSDLVSLLRFSCDQDQVLILLFEGNCLHPKRELLRQQIYPDCTIQVVLVSETRMFCVSSDDEFDDQEISSESFDSICDEFLRISDVQFNLVEGHKKGGLIYQQFLGESDSDEPTPEPQVTVCAPPPSEISKEPLPHWPGKEIPDPRVESRPTGHDRLVDTGRVRREWNW
jgi:hypothetical protein